MSKVEKITVDVPEGKSGLFHNFMSLLLGEKGEAKAEAKSEAKAEAKAEAKTENPLASVLAAKDELIGSLEARYAALEVETSKSRVQIMQLKAELEEKDTLLSQYSGRTFKKTDDATASTSNGLMEGFIDLNAEHNQYLKKFIGQ